MEIIQKIQNVKTLPELNALRLETVTAMKEGGDQGKFYHIQKEFIKAKNRLKRIPLKDRTW